jgi:hypothetical protein
MSYFAYAGPFTVADSAVTHHVQLSLMQDLVGTEQVRTIELDGDRLLLFADVTAHDGGISTHRLSWTRAGVV